MKTRDQKPWDKIENMKMREGRPIFVVDEKQKEILAKDSKVTVVSLKVWVDDTLFIVKFLITAI